MKKIYTILAAMLLTLGVMAQTEKQYTDNLVVRVNGESTNAGPTTVTVVDNGDGTYNFRLKNFVLIVTGEEMPVGNIEATNIPSTEVGGITHLETKQEIVITEGDKEGVDMWVGPMLGVLPLDFKADLTDDQIYAHIDLDLSATINQNIEVILGSPIEVLPEGAKRYTENLVIRVNGAETNVGPTTVVVIDNGDGTYNFRLKNFMLVNGTDEIPVGNIEATNIPSTEANGIIHLESQQEIVVTEGDKAGVDMWYGPMLGVLPLDFKADIEGDHIYAHIDLDLQSTLGQTIEVILGTPIEPLPEGAKRYTENLVIRVNGAETNVGPTAVTVIDNGDGTYNFQLKNFMLVNGTDEIPVGNIEATNIPSTEANGIIHLESQQEIVVTEGDKAGVDMWYGPMLGVLPIDFKADIEGDHIYAHIDLDLQSTLRQTIEVILGTPIIDDAITSVTGCQSESRTYDLSGRRVGAQRSGLYIVNGKKVVR